jgi:hypothetical protein
MRATNRCPNGKQHVSLKIVSQPQGIHAHFTASPITSQLPRKFVVQPEGSRETRVSENQRETRECE